MAGWWRRAAAAEMFSTLGWSTNVRQWEAAGAAQLNRLRAERGDGGGEMKGRDARAGEERCWWQRRRAAGSRRVMNMLLWAECWVWTGGLLNSEAGWMKKEREKNKIYSPFFFCFRPSSVIDSGPLKCCVSCYLRPIPYWTLPCYLSISKGSRGKSGGPNALQTTPELH